MTDKITYWEESLTPELQEDLRKFLESSYFDVDDNLNFTHTMEWENQGLTFENISELVDTYTTDLKDSLSKGEYVDRRELFINCVRDVIDETIDDNLIMLVDNLATNFVLQNLDKGYEIPVVRDILFEKITLYDNLHTLLENTTIPETLIFIGEEWDDVYSKENLWNDIYDDDDNLLPADVIDDRVKDSYLAQVLALAGYKPSQFVNNEAYKTNDFIKKTMEEIYDYTTSLEGLQPVLVPVIEDLETLVDLYSNEFEELKVKKGTVLGLFNKVHGSSSGMNIYLDKDITIPRSLVYETQIYNENGRNDTPFGGPSSVFGEQAKNPKVFKTQVDVKYKVGK